MGFAVQKQEVDFRRESGLYTREPLMLSQRKISKQKPELLGHFQNFAQNVVRTKEPGSLERSKYQEVYIKAVV